MTNERAEKYQLVFDSITESVARELLDEKAIQQYADGLGIELTSYEAWYLSRVMSC